MDALLSTAVALIGGAAAGLAYYWVETFAAWLVKGVVKRALTHLFSTCVREHPGRKKYD